MGETLFRCGVATEANVTLANGYLDLRVELYNLRDDLGKQQNLAAKMPAKADELGKGDMKLVLKGTDETTRTIHPADDE